MFIITTKEEMKAKGWDQLDIILVSGDTYIDSPYSGVAVVARVLENEGYKVGIIAQPDINSDIDIKRLGEPKLFWGVTAGAVDSMVANYTALKKKIRNDDATPGGVNDRRPDRASIKYTNLIKQNFKNTVPIILGGIEASLRRLAHYDYWSDKVRRSLLFDAKADYLVFGMGEKAVLELAEKIKNDQDCSDIRGISYISKEIPEDYLEVPSYEEVVKDKYKYIEMFHTFYKNTDPLNAEGLAQKHGDRYLIQNPPSHYYQGEELDKIYELPYQYDVHPYYKKQGKVKAMDTISNSVTTHRGCYGECNFCAITVHQGRTIRNRTEQSILKEVKNITNHDSFKGYIQDLGGATANMYGNVCKVQQKKGACKDKRCIGEDTCKAMNIDHKVQIDLLGKARKTDGVKKIFIQSGLRYDILLDDKKSGDKYLEDFVEHHVSGQMKIAPEHATDKVLSHMGKPGAKKLTEFREKFYKLNEKKGKKQFLTYYFIAAHPGCEEREQHDLKRFINKELKLTPEQVQIFTPTPSTYSSVMYYTGLDPFTLEPVFVEKDHKRREKQKSIITTDNRKQNSWNKKKKTKKYNK